MQVDLIVARLEAECPLLAQVITAQLGGSPAQVATQAALYTLLNGLVDGRMWPLQLPESPVHPSIVYTMVSSSPGTFEGYEITHSDVFVLNLRGVDYDALLALYDSLTDALAGENIEINDVLHDYDQQESLYRVNIELSYTYLTSASQALPAAFVYPVSRSAGDNLFDNFTKQQVGEDYAVLAVTSGGGMTPVLDEIQAALLGWQQSPDHGEMQYSSGTSIEGIGGMALWRESYRDSLHMTENL